MESRVTWTHQEYFKRFHLNVEQYGEILVAHVFNGMKLGDAQPCYDIETSGQKVRQRLLAEGASPEAVDRCLSGSGCAPVRIEVKSKLAHTPSGRASVIHCSDNKINGARSYQPATHFVVILFDGEGSGTAAHAWFFPREIAQQLRQLQTKSQYIPVSLLKKASLNDSEGVIEICGLMNKAASIPLLFEP